MKWGRKKTYFPSSSSSSFYNSYSTPSPPCSRPSSLISHVFPTSWLSKFKHKSGNSEPKPRKGNPRGKLNSPPLPINSPRFSSTSTNTSGQFYGLEADDDAFWRLSFGQDSAEEKKKILRVKSVRYDPDDDEFRAPVSICTNCRRKEAKRVLRSPRSSTRTAKERKSRGELGNAEKRSRRKCRYVSPVGGRSPGLKTIEEEGQNLEHSEEQHSEENTAGLDWKMLKEMKMEEIKSRNEKQRKSLYVSREQQQQRKRTKQINRVRAYSPRTASRLESCKVKALEDKKKAKLKMKKKEVKETRTVENSKTGLDRFAVVKCSYDPRQDFKDSMVEMISEKKMGRPEELEELLACYLTLNSDDYHDMIIKVFRQVWFELLDQNQARFGSELQNEPSFN
ncbi:hypothetical protein TIFTF001_012683 [Ficus carica]|uniref:Transcription repressor n=1 Tax=Ficus carica TaxID=3494 RepID=A0AA88D5D6_FICCA|nr:hypothetical protein TIFTF001_012683 [Ficus carica]